MWLRFSQFVSSNQWNPPPTLSLHSSQMNQEMRNFETGKSETSSQHRYQYRCSPYTPMLRDRSKTGCGSGGNNGCATAVTGLTNGSGGNGGANIHENMNGFSSCVSPLNVSTVGTSSAFPALKGNSAIPSGFASVQQLPDFPSFADFSPYLDPLITEDQFQSLVTMYRAHSQRIMDSVNKFSFIEVSTDSSWYLITAKVWDCK